MTTELRFLVGSVILGLLHLIAASHLISAQRGYRWTASDREQPVPPLHGLANRVDQATTNFLETFPFFAALLLAAHLTNAHSPTDGLGRAFIFLGTDRVCACCCVGYTLVRSVIFWNAALAGIVLLVIALLE
jgi:uncharacterized MAPEG superfamily protein